MVAGDRVERRASVAPARKPASSGFSVRCTRAPRPGNRGKVGDIGVIRGRPAARGAFVSERAHKAPRVSGDKDVRQGRGAAGGSRPVGRRCFKANSARPSGGIGHRSPWVAPVKKRGHHPRPPTPACPSMRRDLTKQLDRSHQFANGTRRRSRVRDRPARRRSRPRHPQAKRRSGPGADREAGSASRKIPTKCT
jgi:hypothetical protein